MAIQVTFGAGNSITRDINGFTTIRDVVCDERVSVGLGLPEDSSTLTAKINASERDLGSAVHEEEHIFLYNRPAKKGA